ncbi:MAG TPA: MerR family DNA-binding transcriptional regulator [Sphingomonadaceae bacterium]|nr:MerR family DNA-binding transcriptional regulator [Sphingomonadaceae bacterium]
MPTAAARKPGFDVTAREHSGAHLDRPDAEQREHFSISDLTREFGVTARALRFYEDEGLIAPSRAGLSRIYSKRDRARLAWIMRAKNVGFSLVEIREMIDLYDLNDGRVEQRRVTMQRCREKIAKLKKQKADIESSIKELTDFVTHIETLELDRKAASAN